MNLWNVFGRNGRRRRAHALSPTMAVESLEPKQMLSGVSLSSEITAPETSSSEILVKFEDGFDVEAVFSSQATLPGPFVIDHLGGGFDGDERLFEISVNSTTDTAALLDHYNGLPFVDYAEPNATYALKATPNDAQRATQWALDYVDAAAAWDLATDSSAITVAVIDNGIQTDHPDLRDNLWRNTDEIPGNNWDDDGNGYVDDIVGFNFGANSGQLTPDFHGTFVAGIAGAVGNNGRGISGASWRSSVMALQVGVGNNYPVSNLVRAIDYAVANGARVINASWGGYDDSRAIFDAVKRAESAGVLFVVSAGNDGKNLDESMLGFPFYWNVGADVFPAEYSRSLSNVLTVGSLDRSGWLSDFSNYSRSAVQIAAPGRDVLSTNVGSSYSVASGTSAAAPLVAGAAALVWAQDPGMSYREVRNILLDTARPENLTRIGYGSLDLGAAVRRARELTNPTVFDPQLYLDLNPDLASAFGATNHSAARRHWLDLGITEGRRASAAFDVQWYQDLNPDLVAVFGRNNYRELIRHWVRHGMSEGRAASALFDVRLYQELNADLVGLYGWNNYQALLNHFVDTGFEQGRVASTVFDARYYQQRYHDLSAVFGKDNFSAFATHWLRQGLAEGRAASTVFDVEFYGWYSTDLSTDNEARLRHWLTQGIAQGRRASAAFDVQFYQNRHADVRDTFGPGNYRPMIQHWMRYGLHNGRASAREFDVSWYLNQHPDLQQAFGARGYREALHHFLLLGQAEGRRTSSDFGIESYRLRYADLQAFYGRDYVGLWKHWLRLGQWEGRDPR
ncbi:MAG: S8 family serine peptidase [Planctomycetaceae bacterium]|nr:S8 family serine peptidase [Planctomycetaceae bacterium]